jgi:hypothetical protein
MYFLGEAQDQASCLSDAFVALRCSSLLAPRHLPPQTQTSPGSGGQRARRLAGSRCQSWNGFNGGAGCTYIRYTRSAAQSLLAVESAQGGIMLHAAAG